MALNPTMRSFGTIGPFREGLSLGDQPREICEEVFSYLPDEDRKAIYCTHQRFALYGALLRVHEPRAQMDLQTLMDLLARCGKEVLFLDFSRIILPEDREALNESAVQQIFSLCPNLQVVTFFENDTISLKGLIRIVQNTPSLRILNVADCRNIDNAEALQALVEVCPHVGFVKSDTAWKLGGLLAQGLLMRDFLRLGKEGKEKFLENVPVLRNLMGWGVDSAEFIQLEPAEKEVFYNLHEEVSACGYLLSNCQVPLKTFSRTPPWIRSQILRYQWSVVNASEILNLSWEQQCKLPYYDREALFKQGTVLPEILEALEDVSPETPLLEKCMKVVLLLTEGMPLNSFVAQRALGKERMVRHFNHFNAYLKRGAPFSVVLQLDDKELKCKSLRDLICSSLDNPADYLQLRPSLRKRVSAKAPVVQGLVKAGILFEDLIGLNEKDFARLCDRFYTTESVNAQMRKLLRQPGRPLNTILDANIF